MESLATEILGEIKKKATFWKVSAFVILAVAVIEFMIIVFQKGKGIKNYGKRKNHKQFGQYRKGLRRY